MSLSHSKCSIKCLSDEDLMAQKFVGENFPFDCKFSAIIHSQSNCYCTQEFPWHFVPVTYQYWKLSISKIRLFFSFKLMSGEQEISWPTALYSTSKHRIIWHDISSFTMMTPHLSYGPVTLRCHLLSLQRAARCVPCSSRWLEAWRVNGSDYFMNSDSWSGT